MQILSIDTEPVAVFRYNNVAPGSKSILTDEWPVLAGKVDRLPEGIDSLLVSSDLQGHSRELTPRLLGEWLIEAIAENTEIDLENAGTVFAGDLFAEQHKRGGLGDASGVWRAWSRRTKWVCGVKGNHDLLEVDRGQFAGNAYVLDGDIFEPDGVKFGGVGGIIGRKNKTNRRPQDEFFALIDEVLVESPQVLILHHPPMAEEGKLRGSAELAQHLLGTMDSGMVICGHRYWEKPWVKIGDSLEVLNTEHRTIWLTSK